MVPPEKCYTFPLAQGLTCVISTLLPFLITVIILKRFHNIITGFFVRNAAWINLLVSTYLMLIFSR